MLRSEILFVLNNHAVKRLVVDKLFPDMHALPPMRTFFSSGNKMHHPKHGKPSTNGAMIHIIDHVNLLLQRVL